MFYLSKEQYLTCQNLLEFKVSFHSEVFEEEHAHQGVKNRQVNTPNLRNVIHILPFSLLLNSHNYPQIST